VLGQIKDVTYIEHVLRIAVTIVVVALMAHYCHCRHHVVIIICVFAVLSLVVVTFTISPMPYLSNRVAMLAVVAIVHVAVARQ